MGNKSKIFIYAFIAIFSIGMALASFVSFKLEGKIDYSFCILLSLKISVVGAAIATIALPKAKGIQAEAPQSFLVGMRIALIAFFFSILGYVMVWAGFPTFGVILAAAGVVVGALTVLACTLSLLVHKKSAA